jgi:hypothetical protein
VANVSLAPMLFFSQRAYSGNFYGTFEICNDLIVDGGICDYLCRKFALIRFLKEFSH